MLPPFSKTIFGKCSARAAVHDFSASARLGSGDGTSRSNDVVRGLLGAAALPSARLAQLLLGKGALKMFSFLFAGRRLLLTFSLAAIKYGHRYYHRGEDNFQ